MSLPIALARPNDRMIRDLLERGRDATFNYDGVGLSRDAQQPPRYRVNAREAVLGHGPKAFDAARKALERWEMFRLGWAELCWPDAPIEVGSTVAVLAHRLGLWSLNPCRVVYTLDDEEGDRIRFGFGYGTLPGHIMRGEERFMVAMDQGTGAVTYGIHAFARSGSPWVRPIRPALVVFQRQFARASIAAMRRAVEQG